MLRYLSARFMSQSTSNTRLAAVSRHLSTTANMGRPRLANPALFVCDIQEKFRPAIYEFPKVIATAAKMVKACTILNIPIYITTQNEARLGATVSEVTTLLPSNLPSPTGSPSEASKLSSTSPPVLQHDKTAFSMCTPPIAAELAHQATPATSGPQVPVEVLLVGIETHICVTQTALDLLSMGHKVYVLADGVSSCNAGERPIALARLRSEGCTITTSEGVLFELVGDASDKGFKAISGLVKETKDDTKSALEVFGQL